MATFSFASTGPFEPLLVPTKDVWKETIETKSSELTFLPKGRDADELRSPANSDKPLPLTETQLAKEVEYLLRNKWVPCLEFELEHGFPYRENNRSPGYYDGRYWTMWKLPMFGCNDASQVLKELNECKKEYPQSWVRIIGFDNVRQVQCISFIAHKPDGY
ncbi:hypothetical protein EHS17_15495 [Rhodobacteraceae bacterium CH30]|nr:hypothetical protein EHS17_15495 [Rhodobacteraceae bacterium CH30]